MARTSIVTIVGGGLAGLAAANALKSRGFDVEVFEQAPSLGEIGAAITCSFQAGKVMRAMGLGDRLAAIANTPAGKLNRDMLTGDVLHYSDLEAQAVQQGVPYSIYHRADLLNVLAGHVGRIHLGHQLIGLEEGADGIELSFANGVVHKAEVLIGADGIHSIVRRMLYGDVKPQFTGQMVSRALIHDVDVPPEVLDPSQIVEWLGPNRHIIAYYLRGRRLIQTAAQSDVAEWVEEGWSRPGDPDELRASFADAEARVKALLGKVTQCHKWGLFTRPLSHDWGRGRIQLIGDAAHAMLPNLGQGAVQGFEDAFILARWLEAEPDPERAFEAFRRVRIPRVHLVQQASAEAAKMKHMQDRDARKKMLDQGSDWLWTYDPVRSWHEVPAEAPR